MKQIAYFFIDRPIFASVLSILIVLIGSLALFNLPIAQYPEIVPPSISVRAVYPGANASVLAETVATPIEQEVNGVENMLYLSSQSGNDGIMQLTVTFKPGTNLDTAQIQVQNRVSLAEPRLPEEVRRQGVSIRKRSPDLSLVVNLISPNGRYDSVYLSNYAQLKIRDSLARLPGVGDIAVFGNREYSMRVWLDPDKVAARGLTAGDVVKTIREQNVQVAAGVVGQPPTGEPVEFQWSVSTQGRLPGPEQFGDVIIKTGANGQMTRLKDVARIELGAKDYATELKLNGQQTVGLAVFQLPGTNAIDTKKAVVDTMETLKRQFPEDMEYVLVYDTVVFIEKSIEAVVGTLFEAIVLVVLVVLLFLQNWRATLIPLLAVPVSLIGTLAALSALELSLNTLSLFGMVLAIGIVVDDAIVVVENVERNMALGHSAREATRRAMSEVTGPIIATALVLVAVFVPTAFITGVSGAFYRQFALTISVSTLISAFNSLTLSPALCALMLDQAHTSRRDILTRLLDLTLGWLFRGFNRIYGAGSRFYERLTGRLIRFSAVVLVLYALLNGLNGVVFNTVPTGFIPPQDQGYLILYAQLPDAASFQRTDAVVAKASEIALQVPGVKSVNAYTGFSILSFGAQSNSGTLFARLTSFEERAGHPELHADAILLDLQRRLSSVEEAYIAVFAPPPIRGLSSVGGYKFQIQDRSSVGIAELEKAAGDIIAQANQLPTAGRAFTTFRGNVPQLQLDVNRPLAKSMQVALSDIFDTLQIYLGSLYVNDFNLLGRTYQVVAQADARFRAEPEDIARLKTRTRQGDMVPLGTLVEVRESPGPDRISHYNLYPSIEVNGILPPGITSGQAIASLDQLLRTRLPQALGFEWTEISLQQILAGNTAFLIFPLSVIFVYLTLAAQYESWTLPLAILLIVPLCLLSSMTGLWLVGMENNIFTQVGFIVLVGLASKNAILIVEFARQRQQDGKNRVDAAIEAAGLRLRPILMTSLAFIMGVFPLVVSTGAGAESRRLMGTAVFSGMIGVTLFGLLMTPVFYVAIRHLVEARKPGPDHPVA